MFDVYIVAADGAIVKAFTQRTPKKAARFAKAWSHTGDDNTGVMIWPAGVPLPEGFNELTSDEPAQPTLVAQADRYSDSDVDQAIAYAVECRGRGESVDFLTAWAHVRGR